MRTGLGCGRPSCTAEVPWVASNCCNNEILSESSSHMSTYWCERIFSTSLLGSTSLARDRMRPPPGEAPKLPDDAGVGRAFKTIVMLSTTLLGSPTTRRINFTLSVRVGVPLSSAASLGSNKRFQSSSCSTKNDLT